ncbi:MAG: D-2-hydroxyacid dehydrogenase [Deltaproteobacteria bacterium]|nr:MAG: D-2-hydroxyacid dehydrogenase [Deltaproteobacteria bacterium]
MKIVVLDGYTLNPGDNSWDAVGKLGELKVYDRTAPHELLERTREAGIILTNKMPLSAETLRQLQKLRFISVLATGYNIVDIVAAGERGIPVSNVPEYGTDSVAQFAFALLLELCHHVGIHDIAVKAGEWAASPDWSFWKTPQILLTGKTMGIVGFGRIGRRVGELAHAFGMEVLAFDPQQGDAPDYTPFHWKSQEDLFAEADVVSLHCPQTPDNRRFVNRDLISLMKKGAFFINAARGGLVNENDLAEALNTGRIAGAAIDVVSMEPMQSGNLLVTARNCLITPHIAWATLTARQKLMTATTENIKAFLSGSPINVVNTSYITV